VVGVVGAGQREVAQGAELRLDAVQPGRVKRRVGQLDVVLGRPLADRLAEVRAEVVQYEVQADLGRIQGADVAAEGEELDAALALFDVPVEGGRRRRRRPR
jgi:hypothetical protein